MTKGSAAVPEQTFVCFECATEFTKKTALQVHQIFLDPNGFPHGTGAHLGFNCPKCRSDNYYPKIENALKCKCGMCTAEFPLRKIWWLETLIKTDTGQDIILEQTGICPNCQANYIHLLVVPKHSGEA